MELKKQLWNKRYLDSNTGWDVGYITTPIREYIDQIKNKEIKVLIPGSGNGYEAEYLFELGFKNIFVLDYAKQALKNFKSRVNSFPKSNIYEINFFDLNQKFDLIIEQTFFCALDINLRISYINKMSELLNEDGKLVGVLFDDKFNNEGPPFGANFEEYKKLFKAKFFLKTFEKCCNSIPSRSSNEFFLIAKKKHK
tara:strand:- start:20283 stop:20870 length:588 start_codon:yes stop_codon:yes gene_type:complete